MIETKRLILRPFTENDAVDLYEYLKEPSVNCFACMQLNSIEDAVSAAKKRAEDAEYYFAIVLKDSGKVIGEIFSYPEASDPETNVKEAVSYTATSGLVPVCVLVVSALVMVVCGLLMRRPKLKWLSEYALPISLILGMAAAIPLTAILGMEVSK